MRTLKRSLPSYLLLQSLSVDDVVIGVVVSVMETGLVARLLCVDSPSMDRDIDELDITVS